MATLAATAHRNACIQAMEKTANISANVSRTNVTFLVDVFKKRELSINIKFKVCICIDLEC